jgi:CBS domain-containing protein
LIRINRAAAAERTVPDMKAADIMVKDVVTVGPEAPVRDVATLMLERHISGLPVVDGGGSVLGIVSEGDLIRRPELETDRVKLGWLRMLLADDESRARDFVKHHGRTAREVMTQPAHSVTADTPLDEVVRRMERHRIKRLPVLERGKLVGLVTRTDLLRALVTRLAAPPVALQDEELRARIDAILRAEDWASSATVHVQVENGVALLWGTVESREQREALLVAVRGVPGVKDVQPHLGRALPG